MCREINRWKGISLFHLAGVAEAFIMRSGCCGVSSGKQGLAIHLRGSSVRYRLTVFSILL